MRTKNLRFMILGIATLFFAVIAQAQATTLDSLLRDKNDPVAGNAAGKVTIVEFFDYQCSYCGSMIPTITEILRSNPQVRIVFKEYPIRGPESELASRAALAANMQGKYLAFSHALFGLYNIDKKSIAELAKAKGLNVDKLLKDMTSSSVSSQLQKTYDLGNELNINGTPSFYIAKTNETNMKNVESIYGEASRSELETAIKRVS